MLKAGPAGLFRGKRKWALLAAFMLLLTRVVSGTIAWLTDETVTITNTFGYGDVHILLDETDTELDSDDDPTTNTYEMLPGNAIIKDPRVTVLAETQDCWLFVRLEKSENFDDFIIYETALDEEEQPLWNPLNGVENVYWRAVDHTETDLVFPIFKDDQVLVNPDVTVEMLRALGTAEGTELPKLSIQAIAVQRDEGIPALATAEDAWQTFSDQLSSTAP